MSLPYFGSMCGRYVSPGESEIERFWHIGRHNYEPFGRLFSRFRPDQAPAQMLRQFRRFLIRCPS